MPKDINGFIAPRLVNARLSTGFKILGSSWTEDEKKSEYQADKDTSETEEGLNDLSLIDPLKNINNRLIYHIRFHLADNISYNFTNNKKNIILKTKLNNIWLFKSEMELIVEDSILVDNNITIPTKQIVIKGIINNNKQIRKWSLEKI